MAAAGKLEVDVELKTSADKFWESIRDSSTVFPKALPHHYKSIQVLEGDGKSVGSVRLIHYAEASSLVTFDKERIDAVDEEKKILSYSVIEGDLLKFYKSFKATLMVSAKGDGSSVKWVSEFEKASDEIPDPNIIRDFAVENFTKLDAYLKA
ncbi:hypothetical protein RHMOL_Rhmol12G0144000 [Rhododendron molle]|uniref:Uncharacterized protein n=1 Tax=Rhododendron molle TaxID=49168 RepID=A0ACC0LI03_RHOML|nr:hypothetical protein RHMOL_Rhmol12G0144000 [Rhododendron molle]